MLFALLAGWALLVVAILAVCRAAARADEAQHTPRLARGLSVGLAAAASSVAVADGAAAGDARVCANADVAYETAPKLAREALLCEIDRVRERRGVRRLRGQRRLGRAAWRHADDMVEREFFSHVSPGGGEFSDRLRRAGYARRGCRWRAGEILAWGLGRRSAARGIVAAWLDSPPHRRILLSGRYGRIGVGSRLGTPLYGPDRGVTVAAVLGRRSC